MPNEFQTTIAEITRVRKRFQTNINKNEKVLLKASKLLKHTGSNKSALQHAIADIASTRDQLKSTLDNNDRVLLRSSKLLRETGIRPYRKKSPYIGRRGHKKKM